MGSRLVGTLARKARPILNGRDYDNAKKRLAAAMQQPGWVREDERIDALTVALNEFETRYVARELQRAVEWAECVFVPSIDTPDSPRRRWTDPRDPVASAQSQP
jgi:hypothetical protein